MKHLLLCLFLIPAMSFGTAKATGIYLIIKGDNGSVIHRKNISGVSTSKKNLDLGESVDGGIATLQGPNSGNLKIEYQLESTLGLNDEGPHLDLHDWKHSVSDWKPLDAKGPGAFQFPKDLNYTEFPSVSMTEITEAVKRYGTPKWVELSKQCKSPNEYPCHVGTSQIRIRVLRGGDTIHTATLVTPMGC